MGEMNIKLHDQHLIDGLVEMAKIHNRPVEAEVREILSKAVRSTRPMDRLAKAQRIAAMTPWRVIQTDSTILLREDRDR